MIYLFVAVTAFLVLLGLIYNQYSIQKRDNLIKKLRQEVYDKDLENVKLKTILTAQEESHQKNFSTLDARIQDSLKKLSNEALIESNKNFMQMAEKTFQHSEKNISTVLSPMKDVLKDVQQKMDLMEKDRLSTNTRLHTQILQLCDLQKALKDETQLLAQAFRKPSARGQWGEIQLKRVVEIAGMVEHCDFYNQVSTNEGRSRPDMVIRMPGDRFIVIDAKTPMSAFLEAMDEQDMVRKDEKLLEHARQVRVHIKMLATKKYWQQFETTPEFVVLFLPNETFFSTALQYDPSLLEFGTAEKVLLATPTTLVALLKTINYAWQSDRLGRSSEEICRLGRELFERIGSVSNHFTKLGKSLEGSMTAYEQTQTTLNNQVYRTAQKLSDLKVFETKNEIKHIA